MSKVRDSLADLENHLDRLRDQIQQLRKALQHWQTWDAEYENLKEVVTATSESCPTTVLLQIRDDFAGQVIGKAETEQVFGVPVSRSREQVLNLLDRRLDYVGRNVETLQKQLEVLENKYAAASVISYPGAKDEDDNPITDIIEELDEEDNVVSHQLKIPEDSWPLAHQALKDAGVRSLPTRPSSKQNGDTDATTPRDFTSLPTTHTKDISEKGEPVPQKQLTFPSETKSTDPSPSSILNNEHRVKAIVENAKQQESITSSEAIIPQDEDPEDAFLRQEMLAYGLSGAGEVGAIVAELQLDEGDSDYGSDQSMGDDDYEMDDTPTDDNEGDEIEEEDSYGRSTDRLVTNAYAKRMLELEKRLGIQSRFMLGSVQDEASPDSDDERVGRIMIQRDGLSSTGTPAEPTKSNLKQAGKAATRSTTKGVRFASTLDISHVDDSPSPVYPVETAKADPLSDVKEKTHRSKISIGGSSRPQSRFEKANAKTLSGGRAANGPPNAPPRFLDSQHWQETPTGPKGKTIADTLVEKPTTGNPRLIDDFDDPLAYQEVATENQRLRRKFIQREGGFLKEDESIIQPLDDDEGGRRHMSRFKAARLSKQ